MARLPFATLKDSRAVLTAIPQQFAAQYRDELRRDPFAFRDCFNAFLISLEYHAGSTMPSVEQCEGIVLLSHRESRSPEYPFMTLLRGECRELAWLLWKRVEQTLVTPKMRPDLAPRLDLPTAAEILKQQAQATEETAADRAKRRERIAEMIKQKGLTRSGWAEQASEQFRKIDSKTTKNYLNGKTKELHPGTIKRLARVIGLDDLPM